MLRHTPEYMCLLLMEDEPLVLVDVSTRLASPLTRYPLESPPPRGLSPFLAPWLETATFRSSGEYWYMTKLNEIDKSAPVVVAISGGKNLIAALLPLARLRYNSLIPVHFDGG